MVLYVLFSSFASHVLWCDAPIKLQEVFRKLEAKILENEVIVE